MPDLLHTSQRRKASKLAAAVIMSLLLGASQGHAQTSLPALTPSLERLFDGYAPRNVDDLRQMQRYNRLLSKKVMEATVSVQIGSIIGSGVVVSPDGLILTAAHVAGEPGNRVFVQFADGTGAEGETLGIHRPFDAAMIQVHRSGSLPFLPLAPSGSVRRGQWCAATGHPGGFSRERGPVFRLGRILDTQPLIRTDCQLVGGDSGGPLVNLKGEVIGIHSRIGVSLANNLHNPVSIYQDHWKGLVSGKIWTGSSYIGVRGDRRTDLAIVTFVHDDSPASKAGIQVGDVITRFAGQRVQNFSDLVNIVQLRQPGEQVEVELLRDDQALKKELRVGRRDADDASQKVSY